MNQDYRTVLIRRVTIFLGVVSFLVVLLASNIADGDLWGKLAIGAHVWKYGTVPVHDTFAFTPVLPRYIEHEWGAGTIFFGVLKFFGPVGLMWLKILLAFGAMLAGMATDRRLDVHWNALLLLAVPVAACLMPGYGLVVRSHAFTYCFFGLTLLCLEVTQRDKTWPAFILPLLFLVWSNVHGGFVAGEGAVAVYTVFALINQRRVKFMLLTALACAAVTLINIYGLKFWAYFIPAILNKRPLITEWQPLPLLGNDSFLGFRILFLLVAVIVIITWRKTEKRSWPGLIMLAVTAFLAWRSRRHVPFFAVTTLAFAGPFLQTLLSGLFAKCPERLRTRLQPAFAVAILYGALSIYAAAHFLPRASFVVLAPVGDVPVREVDILSLAKAKGNLATPFSWGCYCSWRLYPRIKISMDGRYETTYPESTFDMNYEFYAKAGTNWDRLIRDYTVDYVILDLAHRRLRPEDLTPYGYNLIWRNPGQTALLSLQKHVTALREVATNLPPTTINPLDATIPDKWWSD